MSHYDDLLVEIHTEELPPKSLLKLAKAFAQQMQASLEKAQLAFTELKFYATPRRLAIIVLQLAKAQADQMMERKGPAVNAAFDAQGNPTPACLGFARSLNITPNELIRIKNKQGEWVGYHQHVAGKTLAELLPEMVNHAALHLPIPKRMRWGNGDATFVRPVHSVILLYGKEVITANLFGHLSGRKTRGHRFHAPEWIDIQQPADYLNLLSTQGKVMADFALRREYIRNTAIACLQKKLKQEATVLFSSNELLDEVTGLVEWPVALCGHFDARFLALPKEILISAMQDHQRYFPVCDQNQALLPYFITISNIDSKDSRRVIHGNERVLRARLADADFFYHADKESLSERLHRLKGIVFQAKLGSLYQKAERLQALTKIIARHLNLTTAEAERAGLLAKTDLTTHLVNEFPELQGTIGYYYALRDQESSAVALSLQEHYLPRFSGDILPASALGQALAIADRVDTLVGSFGLGHIPTGDKDPYGLRRATLGLLRILIEKKLNIDLLPLFEQATQCYREQNIPLENQETVPQLWHFMQERLRAWYQEQGIAPDVFAAVAALRLTNALDIDARIKAVQSFKHLEAARSLCMANKRVSNILAQTPVNTQQIDTALFEHSSEKELAHLLEKKSKELKPLKDSGQYHEILLQLAELNQPIDHFFNEVLVMSENKAQRENRILLLSQLRTLFLQVADIALLQ